MNESRRAKPMLADRMLGKLARLLRMVGHDVEYVREGAPLEIARRAAREERVFLTRDRRLAMRKDIGQVVFVENNYPFHQARQVLRDLAISTDAEFRRCVDDNGLLEPLPSELARGRVPEYVLERSSAFFRCDRCARIYWDGTHVAAMRELIAQLEGAPLVLDDGEGDEAPEEKLSRLEPLVDLHHAFDVLFLRHRIALMDADVGLALRLFRRFALCMRRHVDDERDLVLPVYASCAPKEGYERGAGPELFEHEHRKILDHMARIEGACEAVSESGDDPLKLRARCLQLLDREKVFADLLEHHDLREREHLYPALERMLTDEEKTDLLERMVGMSMEVSG